MIIEGNKKEKEAMEQFHINAKIKLLSELTEHTIDNEIEAPHEILRKECCKTDH